MDRQTLRDWVHRYNAEGLAGLRNLRSPGPRSKLTVQQQAELALLVEAGPDPDRSVGKILAKLGYRRLSVRPRHPEADEVAQEAFKKTSPRRMAYGRRGTSTVRIAPLKKQKAGACDTGPPAMEMAPPGRWQGPPPKCAPVPAHRQRPEVVYGCGKLSQPKHPPLPAIHVDLTASAGMLVLKTGWLLHDSRKAAGAGLAGRL